MLTYSAEHDALKVMMGMDNSQNSRVCKGYRPRLDNFGMDFVPSTTLYVNVRHCQSFIIKHPERNTWLRIHLSCLI